MKDSPHSGCPGDFLGRVDEERDRSISCRASQYWSPLRFQKCAPEMSCLRRLCLSVSSGIFHAWLVGKSPICLSPVARIEPGKLCPAEHTKSIPVPEKGLQSRLFLYGPRSSNNPSASPWQPFR